MTEPVRLTQYAHGGGCGCKIAPGLLQQILGDSIVKQVVPQLLVGVENSDDAAVYQLNNSQAIVATTDFFLPIVDDPYDFGRIAATNALSDIYAMGGTPLFALAIVGMPINKLPATVIREILRGGEEVCKAAGIPIAGGHSIDAPEPIYGLVGIGVVQPNQLKRNDTAQAGDVLILGKPLGVGVYSAALKKGALDAAGYAAMLASTTQLNTVGTALASMADVHAMTDVTGFGLLGHGWEMARGAKQRLQINLSQVPLLPAAAALAQQGFITGASERNWQGYGEHVQLFAGGENWQRALLTDPQTSGGLLLACAPTVAESVLALFRQQGFVDAAIIGRVQAGDAGVDVLA
ncbi:selenide, water dikinase SelD [Permianibacter sp. IMCC34836]|uniref:selenide, water dikinase SelD n=1 Tax=Permianibacter fluminis TaxID=2738515 RepID=UPI001552B7B4|nr:selenide, water dikinase SelD [Permianibacter fluminis]NQD36491.1 selenide, water dikinase SelD [Permianibacter fluminis]